MQQPLPSREFNACVTAVHRRSAILWVRIPFLIWTVLIAVALEAADRPMPQVGAVISNDVEIPDDFSGGNPIAYFDDFSWRSFLAINWPAVAGRRGVADTHLELGAAATAVVWETWKADYETTPPEGTRPTPWDSFDAVTPCDDVTDVQSIKLLVGSFSSGGSLVVDHYNQAGFGTPVGTLIGQNRRYVRYEIRINRTEFDFIRGPDDDCDRWFYLAKNLPRRDDPPLVFPAGSIELKAAWREFKLPDEMSLLPRYYTRETLISSRPGGPCETKTLGLVGLHIVHRTPTRREWVWSSFEHVDNVEPTSAGIQPTFRDPASTAPTNLLKRLVDEMNPPLPDPDPVQVRRVKPIHDSTKQTNSDYQGHSKVAGTVWKNYQLVLTQWPTTPASTDDELRMRFNTPDETGRGNPFPKDSDPSSIANVTMETRQFFQSGVSCMTCHHFRAPHPDSPNTEFVWFLRLRAHRENKQRETEEALTLRAFEEGINRGATLEAAKPESSNPK